MKRRRGDTLSSRQSWDVIRYVIWFIRSIASDRVLPRFLPYESRSVTSFLTEENYEEAVTETVGGTRFSAMRGYRGVKHSHLTEAARTFHSALTLPLFRVEVRRRKRMEIPLADGSDARSQVRYISFTRRSVTSGIFEPRSALESPSKSASPFLNFALGESGARTPMERLVIFRSR